VHSGRKKKLELMVEAKQLLIPWLEKKREEEYS